jgi:hypothetical protein
LLVKRSNELGAKAYLGTLIDCVEVSDDRIRTFGRKELLQQAELPIPPGQHRVFGVLYASGAP